MGGYYHNRIISITSGFTQKSLSSLSHDLLYFFFVKRPHKTLNMHIATLPIILKKIKIK
jgi:hypothetical protein